MLKYSQTPGHSKCSTFNSARYIFSQAQFFQNMISKFVHHFYTTAGVIRGLMKNRNHYIKNSSLSHNNPTIPIFSLGRATVFTVYVFAVGWYRSLPTNTLTKPPSFYHKKKTEKSFELHTCLNSLYPSGYAYPCDSCSAVLLPPGTRFLCGKMAGFLGTAGLQDGSRLSIPSTDHSFETQWYIL